MKQNMFFKSFNFVGLSLILFSLVQVRANLECDLCPLRTDQIIKNYGYEAEEHRVTTADGYIITIFRCNSKRNATQKRKAMIVQHGILGSSDDFTTNIPSQAVAYVLADENFDIWLPNSRGNYYSRRHISKNPDIPSSGFWNFSWYELAVNDLPAVIDYVLKQTNNKKLYYVGYSQGTTTLLTLLAERIEYNEKIYAAGLMANMAYVSLSCFSDLLLDLVQAFLKPLENTEIFPRSLGQTARALCALDLSVCNEVLDFIFGPSQNQRNDTMLPLFVCRAFSGSSVNQFLHYFQENNYGYFGKYMRGSKVPPDFNLSQINIPISLHYSTSDSIANSETINKLLPKLQKNKVRVRVINELFDHIDFIWSKNAASRIYTKILKFFNKYQ